MTSAVVFILLAILELTSGSCTRGHAPNIARGGTVTQSSIYADSVPERAIDGSRDSHWGEGTSCTQTEQEIRPWWRLDLQREYQITNVTITNRVDCCHERINGAEIRIGNSLEDHGNSNPRCIKIDTIEPGESKTFECNGMMGQYINILIPDRNEHLTLCEVEVTGERTGNTPQTALPAPNIARGGTVTQSSPYGDAAPERAIDGRPDSIWTHGSCTHTDHDNGPWWRLKLQKKYKINTVTITNRGDCCPERINGAEIRIGNSLDNNGNNNPRCTKIKTIARGRSKTFECNGMVGQYINIVIPDRQEYLTLCEVEVTGEPIGNTLQTAPNIARGGTVTQSSIYADAIPERAIDGSRDSHWREGTSCAHTEQENRPWWRLDLPRKYKINTVTITNREDCCHERINGAEIRIGNSLDDNGNANPRCTKIDTIEPGESKTFECNGMVGQYINIVIPDRNEYLTLCEVEVTGEPTGNTRQTAPNIARGGKASQSSVFHGGVPHRAIDGNLDSHWGLGTSCTHTEQDNHPWWRLDLQKEYQINTVTITNRRDCCPERINGAEIRIGNSLDDNGNANPRCTKIDTIAPGKSKTFECNGMVGQYINIVIPDRHEYLTLCEVEVTGEPTGNTPQTVQNIARLGTVTQSSPYGDAAPERAIDGRRDSQWRQGSCTHTEHDNGPWWRLDLLKKYNINTVTITNRGDCCYFRLNGAEIRIGNSLDDNGNANPRCALISTLQLGETKTFKCHGMVGQYINIVIPNRREYLTLCEVEVTGTEAVDPVEEVCN
ncbi:uncharacterized protein LOC121514334 [Cheilinus undulatus]|uniref:uncharacterized protein LOC121514334 n=1 Tax=Cheilinus undulatus TaxID=241271 RepID=UPI001BD5CDA0|nr:uncharacterized protein LOC121514334 [Cheilinus undulatus]XP_041650442.1 uncharacterized protein LOC121514334 [Cheilinus undulatus]XP_041650443.1 uncharacterized protein LOC121514334 [Cheilinus undulatus]XP_041650444.1 uncharacterized protein LOC121514334 [Cheilinus undulatus]